MSCCGSSVPSATLTARHRLRLRYGGGRPIEVTGPVTGTTYRFSGMARVQLVDPRDGIAILRNNALRMEGIVEVQDHG
jgi:hypothetical protein